MSVADVMARRRNEPEGGAKGRGHPPDRVFEFHVGNGALEFRKEELSDPVPTGRQIIETAGFSPAEEYLIFQVSHDRRLTELKLDETTDLRGGHEARFIIFQSDRSWRGIIDGKRFEWGGHEILGRVLKWLAGVDPATHGAWLERKDKPDKLIGDEEKARLVPSGVERFHTDRLFAICIEGQPYPWDGKTITTAQIAALGG